MNKLNISKNRNFLTSIVSVVNNRNFTFGMNIEMYVHLLRSTLKLNRGEHQDIVNTSSFRDIKNKFFSGELNICTGFIGHINFVNKIKFYINSFVNYGSNTLYNISE